MAAVGLQLPKGARRADDAQSSAISDRTLWRAALGLYGGHRNPLYSPRELQHQLADPGAEAIVVVENFASVFQEVRDKTHVKHVVTTGLGDMLGFPKSMIVNFVVKHVKKMVPAWSLPGSVSFASALSQGNQHAWSPADLTHDDIAFLQYTGGTTGVPKGAMLTHGNIVANLQQSHAWLTPALDPNRQETIVTALLLYHIFALTANCLTFVKIGAQSVDHQSARHSGLCERAGGHAIHGADRRQHPVQRAARQRGFSQARFLETQPDARRRHGRATRRGREVETGDRQAADRSLRPDRDPPAATINPLTITDYNGSIGLPVPSTEISIRDDDGKEVALGEPGELCVRGPQVMKGY